MARTKTIEGNKLVYIYIQLYTYYLTPSLVEHWSYHYSHVYIALCAFSGLSGLQWPSVALRLTASFCSFASGDPQPIHQLLASFQLRMLFAEHLAGQPQ